MIPLLFMKPLFDIYEEKWGEALQEKKMVRLCPEGAIIVLWVFFLLYIICFWIFVPRHIFIYFRKIINKLSENNCLAINYLRAGQK